VSVSFDYETIHRYNSDIIIIIIIIIIILQPCVGPWPLFSFLSVYTVGSTPWTGDQPVAGPLLTHTEQHKHAVGLEPTSPVFEWTKTVHALDGAATVITIESIIDFLFIVIHIYPYSENTSSFVRRDCRAVSFRHFDSLALVV
jgi:hypothetical protein